MKKLLFVSSEVDTAELWMDSCSSLLFVNYLSGSLEMLPERILYITKIL